MAADRAVLSLGECPGYGGNHHCSGGAGRDRAEPPPVVRHYWHSDGVRESRSPANRPPGDFPCPSRLARPPPEGKTLVALRRGRDGDRRRTRERLTSAV